ncbi:hypothetical protein RugamoR57_28800 [Duganella caerulea]
MDIALVGQRAQDGRRQAEVGEADLVGFGGGWHSGWRGGDWRGFDSGGGNRRGFDSGFGGWRNFDGGRSGGHGVGSGLRSGGLNNGRGGDLGFGHNVCGGPAADSQAFFN